MNLGIELLKPRTKRKETKNRFEIYINYFVLPMPICVSVSDREREREKREATKIK